jgi:hypothetical protein
MGSMRLLSATPTCAAVASSNITSHFILTTFGSAFGSVGGPNPLIIGKFAAVSSRSGVESVGASKYGDEDKIQV